MADAVPAGLVLALAKHFEAELALRDAAGPWLHGELPAPMHQLKELMDRLYVLRERSAELYAEGRATYWLLKSEYEREGTAA